MARRRRLYLGRPTSECREIACELIFQTVCTPVEALRCRRITILRAGAISLVRIVRARAQAENAGDQFGVAIQKALRHVGRKVRAKDAISTLHDTP